MGETRVYGEPVFCCWKILVGQNYYIKQVSIHSSIFAPIQGSGVSMLPSSVELFDIFGTGRHISQQPVSLQVLAHFRELFVQRRTPERLYIITTFFWMLSLLSWTVVRIKFISRFRGSRKRRKNCYILLMAPLLILNPLGGPVRLDSSVFWLECIPLCLLWNFLVGMHSSFFTSFSARMHSNVFWIPLGFLKWNCIDTFFSEQSY